MWYVTRGNVIDWAWYVAAVAAKLLRPSQAVGVPGASVVDFDRFSYQVEAAVTSVTSVTSVRGRVEYGVDFCVVP